jgi:plasmid maintenance system antidote protein VapI
MDNHHLKKILDEIEEKEDLTLKDIAGKVKVDRSNLSTLVNSKQKMPVTPRMIGKFQKQFPKYFTVGNNETTNQHLQQSNDLNAWAMLDIHPIDYINELREDKKRLQNTIDTNLTALMQLLSALSRHDRAFHDTILKSLARLEGKKEVDLVAEARSSEAAKQIEEMTRSNNT